MAHSKSDIATQFKKHLSESRRGLSVQYNNTTAMRAAYIQSNKDYQDIIQFTDTVGRKRRATVKFDKIRNNIDTVVGFMAQNRRQAKYIARVNASQEQNLYSKNMNSLYSYHRENMNLDQLETAQDRDMLNLGYGAIETDLSYIVGNATTSPNGELVAMHIDAMHVGWDATARAQNITDSRWVYYFEDYDLHEALALFQGSKEDDFEQVSETGAEDRAGYVYNPWGGLYDKIRTDDNYMEWSSKEQERVRVYNYQWFEYETFYKARNPIYDALSLEDAQFMQARLEIIKSGIKSYSPAGITAGDLFDFDPSKPEFVFDEETKKKLVDEFGELISPVGFKRKCFYTAVISGKHVFTYFKSVSQQGFSVKFKTGVYNETDKFWIGMTNSMVEPQSYYNKAITEIMFTIASLSKGGVMVEKGAVEDITEFEANYAKTDGVIMVEDGALSQGKIQPKAQASMPNGLNDVITLADSSLAQNGVDPSLLGDTSGTESGVLYKRRIRQAISKLAGYFDSGTLYQKEHARLCADLIRIWIQNNEGVIVRITGGDGLEEFKAISDDMLSAEYDVSIQEAPQTPEEKQELAVMLVGYGDKLMPINPSAAQAFYAESLQQTTLDADARNRLIEQLQPQETVPLQQYQMLEQQLQQMQSELAQLQAAKLQAEIDEKQSNVQYKQAQTADVLESAKNKGLENDIIRTGGYSEAKVSI